MCIDILEKANLERKEKIEMRAEIKKLAWNFAEDIEEGVGSSFDHYLESLLNTLKTRTGTQNSEISFESKTSDRPIPETRGGFIPVTC